MKKEQLGSESVTLTPIFEHKRWRLKPSQRRDGPALILAENPEELIVVICGTERCEYLRLCTMNKGRASWRNIRAIFKRLTADHSGVCRPIQIEYRAAISPHRSAGTGERQLVTVFEDQLFNRYSMQG